MTSEHWDLTAHVRGAISEALVAEAVYQRHADAILHSPRHRGYDVSSVEGDVRVDAKVASILQVDLDGGGSVDAVEWDAGGRTEVLHESATHLGLVVLDSSLTALRLFDGGDVVLRGDIVADGRVFLVPAEVAREESSPIWSMRKCRPSKGRFRYLRLGTVDQHEVEFRSGLTSGGRK
ncbi:hypothetical protein H3H54_11845 [Brachybacterium sp. Z12]|nr:hypothetical protein H3H54_11845 [Brachybacterium sp. Z12]